MMIAKNSQTTPNAKEQKKTEFIPPYFEKGIKNNSLKLKIKKVTTTGSCAQSSHSHSIVSSNSDASSRHDTRENTQTQTQRSLREMQVGTFTHKNSLSGGSAVKYFEVN